MDIGLSNPFNYTGSKHRYLRELKAILPTEDNLTVCDPFVGGGDLCTHLNKTWHVQAFDVMPQIIEMHNSIKNGELTVKDVAANAYTNQLNNKDSVKFLKFRKKYNEEEGAKTPLNLYTLICHSNSNRLRFSNKGFNVSFGDRWFNLELQKKLGDYIERLKEKKTVFVCTSFTDVLFSQYDIVLIDPPYLNSVATYNECGGWTVKDEIILHNKIKNGCEKFVYFGQIWANGKHNKLLDDFSKNYNVKVLKDTTKHCSSNRKDDKTIEVMIWNF